jgi:hypothetical protein
VSLYDLVMGDGSQRSRGAFLIHVLGNPDVGRFRDAWVEKGDAGEPVIVIYTRNGGGNRECYCDESHESGCLQEIIADLQEHPLYLSDEDDEFDFTYATFRFRCPADEQVRDLLAGAAGGRRDMDAEWEQAIAAMTPKAGGGS